MSVVVLAGTPQPPVPSVPLWVSLRHTWVDPDGRHWDLSGGSGLQLLAGTRGMMDPPIVRYTAKSPAVHGSQFRGMTWDERDDVLWRLKVGKGGDSLAWLQHHEEFFQTLDPERPGRWVVTHPTGESRSLTIRYTGPVEGSLDTDLGLIPQQFYDLTFAAENPFWLGDTITVGPFEGVEEELFFGPGDVGGPPFFVSADASLDTATMANPGHVDAWPVWRIHGPWTNVTINGVGFPVAVGEGEWLRIDTAPTDQVLRDQDGVDRTSEIVDMHLLREIRPGGSIPITITATGTGAIFGELTPAYRRAA